MSEAVLNKLKGIENKLDRLGSDVKIINDKLDAVIVAIYNYDQGMDLTAYGLDIKNEED